MKCKTVIYYAWWTVFLQCFCGCITTRNDASIDDSLKKLEDRVAQIPVDPFGLGADYNEVTAACVLDYYRRYGSLEALRTLNRPDVLRRLAKRKSTVVYYKAVAWMLEGLSNHQAMTDGDPYPIILKQYSRA